MPYVQGKYMDKKWPTMMVYYEGYLNELWHNAMQMGHVIAQKRSEGGSGISALKSEILEGLVGSNMPKNIKIKNMTDIQNTLNLHQNLIECLPLKNNC